MNKIRIILKSGRELTLVTDKTANDLVACIKMDSPGSCITFENKGFIMCNEIAALMQDD